MYTNANGACEWAFIQQDWKEIISFISGLFVKQKASERRDAIGKAFAELEKLCTNKIILDKVTALSTKEVSFYNESELLDDFKLILESEQFSKCSKAIAEIPETQRIEFYRELLRKIHKKILIVRTGLAKPELFFAKKKADKAVILDQALYQLSELILLAVEDINKNHFDKAMKLLSTCLIIIIKINGFINDKLSEEDLYSLVAYTNAQLKPTKSAFKTDLLKVLTN